MSSTSSIQTLTALSCSTILLKQPISSDSNGIINKTEYIVKKQISQADSEIQRMQEAKLKKKQELSARNTELKKALFLIENKIKFFFLELEAIRDDELPETLIKHRLILRDDLVNIAKRCMMLKSKYDAKIKFTQNEYYEEIPCFASFNNLLFDLFEIMPYFIDYSISQEIITLVTHPQFSLSASSSSASSSSSPSNQSLKTLFQNLSSHIDAATAAMIQETHMRKKETKSEKILQSTCEILANKDPVSSTATVNDFNKIINELLYGYHNPT